MSAWPLLSMDQLHDAIVQHLGLDFPPERWAYLRSRIEQLAASSHDQNGAWRWLQRPHWSEAEVARLARVLTVGETYFFRDVPAFDALRSEILPELITAGRERGRRLTVWSAGCSSGEEIYSVAILLHRMVRDLADWRLTLVGTDINPEALEKARLGRYGAWSFRETPKLLQRSCFASLPGGRFELNAEIRNLVGFRPANLVNPWVFPFPHGSVDLLFCRNVLMYFHRDCIGPVIRRLIDALRPGGVLLLGPSEMHFANDPEFEMKQIGRFYCFTKKQEQVCAEADSLHDAKPCLASGADVEREGWTETAWMEEQSQSAIDPAADELTPPWSRADAWVAPPQKSVPSAGGSGGFSPETVLEKAREYADHGRLVMAREWAERAVSLSPLQPSSHLLLGVILQEQNEDVLARQAFKKAAFLDPDSPMAYFHLGLIALRQQDRAEASSCLQRTLRLLHECPNAADLGRREGISAREMQRVIQTMLEKIHA